jgi:hypothetical protein
MTATFTGAWLAMKLGVEPLALDLRRRSGELLGVPTEDGTDYVYPAWQFDETGQPLPAVARVVQAGRAAGLRDEELYDLLLRRDGMTGEGRLLDSIREGREERALEAIRAAARLRGRS